MLYQLPGMPIRDFLLNLNPFVCSPDAYVGFTDPHSYILIAYLITIKEMMLYFAAGNMTGGKAEQSQSFSNVHNWFGSGCRQYKTVL